MVSLVLQEAFQTFLLFYSCTFLHFCIFLHYPPPSPSPALPFDPPMTGPKTKPCTSVPHRVAEGAGVTLWFGGLSVSRRGFSPPPLQGSKQGEGLG